MQESTGCSAEYTEPYALRVIGDSMLPEFKDGDIIIIDPGHPLCDGAFSVIEYKGEVFFAQYQVKQATKWMLYLNDEQNNFQLEADFIVKGVVIQRSNGRRKDLKHYHY